MTSTRRSSADIAAALTPNQVAALRAVSARHFETSAAIGFSGSTLTSLANDGLVDVRILVSSIRRGDVNMYRITGRGVVVLGILRRAAKIAN